MLNGNIMKIIISNESKEWIRVVLSEFSLNFEDGPLIKDYKY